jgi:hypothetical protein
MTKRNTLLITSAVICVVLAVSVVLCVAQDKNAQPAKDKFVPSPVFSPPYPNLPHHFSNVRILQILCQAPKGSIKRAVMSPMEATGDADTFVLRRADITSTRSPSMPRSNTKAGTAILP